MLPAWHPVISWAVVVIAMPLALAASAGEPKVTEKREGGTFLIHITAADRPEKVCRIDLSRHHSPATEKTALLKKWESYRLGAVAKQIRLGWKRGAANVLLATAPDHTGKMRPEDVEQLRLLGKILRDEGLTLPKL
jgi:hypothetical protein